MNTVPPTAVTLHIHGMQSQRQLEPAAASITTYKGQLAGKPGMNCVTFRPSFVKHSWVVGSGSPAAHVQWKGGRQLDLEITISDSTITTGEHQRDTTST